MKEDLIQVGWDWEKVKDLTQWKIPEGNVMTLPHLIKNPRAKILDLGCGIGRHTVYFASQGYEVFALDISDEAILSTKKWLKEEGYTAKVEKGSMTKLEFPDNFFDLVIAYNVIYHTFKQDIIQIIDNIFRVLKPEGFFFGTILTKDITQPFLGNVTIIDKQTIIRKEEPEDGIPHFFSTIDDVLVFFKSFEIKNFYYKEQYKHPYTLESIKQRKGHGHYFMLAQKPK